MVPASSVTTRPVAWGMASHASSREPSARYCHSYETSSAFPRFVNAANVACSLAATITSGGQTRAIFSDPFDSVTNPLNSDHTLVWPPCIACTCHS